VLAGAALAGADDQAEIKPIINKALKAMGGEAKVAKLKAGNWKGKITGQENGQQFTVSYEGSLQGWNQYRIDTEAQVGGASMKALFVINADNGWKKENQAVEDAPEGIVPFIKDVFYSMRIAHALPELNDSAFKVSHLGEMKIGDRPAVGLQISHKDHKDVSLFLDKETGLPIKSEIRVTVPKEGKEVLLENFFSDYKEFDGLKHYTKISIKGDNKEYTMELSDIKPVEKQEDSLFAKP
jgi:hypothetical protein